LGSGNNNLMQRQNQEDSKGLEVLNKSGQSDHHRSYTQFGSVDKARDKADKDVANSKEGINQSKTQTKEELDNVTQVWLCLPRLR
jgi:hypothetical protein